MSDPVFIGVGRDRGTWVPSTNVVTDVDEGAQSHALYTGGWQSSLQTKYGDISVGDYFKIIHGTPGTDSGSVADDSNWETQDFVVWTSGSSGHYWRRLSYTDTVSSVIFGDLDETSFEDQLLSDSVTDKQVMFASGSTVAFSGSSKLLFDYEDIDDKGLQVNGNISGSSLAINTMDGDDDGIVIYSQAGVLNRIEGYGSAGLSLQDKIGQKKLILGNNTIEVGDQVSGDVTIKPGTSNTGIVIGDSGTATITVADATNGNITLAPHGTGEVDISKVDIDAGTIDGCDVTVGSGKTLDVSAGTLTTSAAQKKAVVEGAASDVDFGAYEVRAQTFESDVTTGTAPLTIASTTKVANLNVDKLDDADWAAPAAIGSGTPAAGTFTTLTANTELDASGATLTTSAAQKKAIVEGVASNVDIGDYSITGSAFKSDVATGAAPLTVASTTLVTNLNADKLDGQDGSYYTDFSNMTVDNAEIAASKIGVGSFTQTGGSVDNAPIGVNNADVGVFTELTSSVFKNHSSDININIRPDQSVKMFLGGDGSAGHFTVYDEATARFQVTQAGLGTFNGGQVTIQKDTDGEFVALNLKNNSDANDTTGKVSIEFGLETTQGLSIDSGKIRVEKEQAFSIADATTLDSSMVFATSLNNTLTDQMIIKSDGKVGIGTTDPQRNLHVHQANSALHNGLTIRNNASGEGLQMGNNADGSSWINNNESDKGGLHLGGAGSAYNNGHIFISGSGDVGIGTITPEGKLHVYTGDAGIAPSPLADELVVEGAGSTGISILTPNDQVGRLYFGDEDNAARAYVLYDHSVDMMKFSIASGNKLVIDNSGQVGIGVEDPDSKLEVAGKIHISGEQGSAPSAPSDGDGGFLYAKADGKIYWRSNELTETDLTTGGGGGASALNDLSDVSYSSGDLTITSLDKIVGGGNLTIDAAGDIMLDVNNNDIHFAQNGTIFASITEDGDDAFLTFGTTQGSSGYGIMDDNGTMKVKNSGGTWSEIGSAGADDDVNVANLTARLPQITENVTIGDATDVTVNLAGDLTVAGQNISGPASAGYLTLSGSNSGLWISGSSVIFSGQGGPGYSPTIGVGKSDPSYAIDLPNNADATGQIRANAFPTYSSRKYKNNVKQIENVLSKALGLRGVTFTWEGNGKRDIGFIAEEVGAWYPELVTYSDNGVDAETLDYPKMTAVLVECVKALNDKIETMVTSMDEVLSDIENNRDFVGKRVKEALRDNSQLKQQIELLEEKIISLEEESTD